MRAAWEDFESSNRGLELNDLNTSSGLLVESHLKLFLDGRALTQGSVRMQGVCVHSVKGQGLMFFWDSAHEDIHEEPSPGSSYLSPHASPGWLFTTVRVQVQLLAIFGLGMTDVSCLEYCCCFLYAGRAECLREGRQGWREGRSCPGHQPGCGHA